MNVKQDVCIIYTDGGARGNPGPAAAGGVIAAADGTLVAEISEYIGVATNNVAEYRALILTLRRAIDEGCRIVDVRMDSELVVRQLEGKYRVKDAKMRPLHAAAVALLAQFERADVRHVPRVENKVADKLVNAVLDAREDVMREARVGL
ncbi:MAG TPA: ribonuclease HI family protein [Candidatus Eremiobacteraceae bacterium]